MADVVWHTPPHGVLYFWFRCTVWGCFIVHETQLEAGGLRHWVALSIILLLLVFSGLEATHTHATASGNSSRCAVCISLHGSAPAVAVHPLPVLSVVTIVAARHQPQRQSAATQPQSLHQTSSCHLKTPL